LGIRWNIDETSALMAGHHVPHLANDVGADKIMIGVKEFKCMGARPPFDHPHVFLDMGQETQVMCPYCSTLYMHDHRIGHDETAPAGCVVHDHADAHG
jgi:uncharacterized Zn-finger protein